MKLTKKQKYQVQFTFGILIDTWPRKLRGPKIKQAKEYCRDNPKWFALWESLNR